MLPSPQRCALFAPHPNRVVFLLLCSVLLAGCVYPMTTDTTITAKSALGLPPPEQSVMHLSTRNDRYIKIAPDIPDLEWNVLHMNYSPPGTVTVAPGEHAFIGGKFWEHCKFRVVMAAGHAYRPANLYCRRHISPKSNPIPEFVASCLAANPQSRCCTVLEDTAPDGKLDTFAASCDPSYPYPGYP